MECIHLYLFLFLLCCARGYVNAFVISWRRTHPAPVSARRYFAVAPKASTAASRQAEPSASTSAIQLEDPGSKAFEEQPPHAGCHFRPTHPGTPRNHKGPKQNKRFFEGWYYRITLPEDDASFAFIFSIEDPFQNSDLSLCCHQIMGPNDDYLVQADPDHTKFWAWHGQQGLGCVFEYSDTAKNTEDSTTLLCAISPDEYSDRVQSGFQMLPTRLQGKLRGHDGSLGGVMEGQGVPGECDYDISISPISGYGDLQMSQKSTAGWLASYKVFEPHWQVTMADARASGTVTWKGKTYNFTDIPFYAEKNWGGAFPIKWFWCQCNSFDGHWENADCPPLAVTAGGGTRKIPLGKKESLGMVSVHYNGTFYETTPWVGDMDWDCSEWGEWKLKGRNTARKPPIETELIAHCPVDGIKLRAPTEKDGMAYFCRDSFFAQATLNMWELEWQKDTKEYVRGRLIIENATSSQAAVEIGGGPWWDRWTETSHMKQPMKGLVRLPYRLTNLRRRLFAKAQ